MYEGLPTRISFDTNSAKYHVGQPANDEACGLIAYVGVQPDAATVKLVHWLQTQMCGKPGFVVHWSLAGIAPKGTRALQDVQELREACLEPYPVDEHGYFVKFPTPLEALGSSSCQYKQKKMRMV